MRDRDWLGLFSVADMSFQIVTHLFRGHWVRKIDGLCLLQWGLTKDINTQMSRGMLDSVMSSH